jgi:tripeptide aminopeptidase
VQRFLKLAAIGGVSGQESGVAQAITEMLTEAGLDASAIEFDCAESRTRMSGECGNLIVHLPGRTEGPMTLLSAHMDTVPICLGSQPVVRGDRVVSDAATGLGADNRAGCAAILSAAIERLRLGNNDLPPAKLLFTVQEEIGLEGARHLDAAKIGRVDRAFNFDGSDIEKVTLGAIGGERMDIRLTGVPAHAGVAPQKGASAIVMAARAIARLQDDRWLGRVQRDDHLGTANIGVIHGGEATNVVTPEVTLRAEARSHDADFRIRIVSEIRAAFEAAASEVRNDEGVCGSCRFESRVDYEAFRLADDDRSVTQLEQAITSLGRQPVRKVADGGLDANWLNQHGIPAVTVGCGQRNIHTAQEELDLPHYLAACNLAAMMICQPAES